MASVNNTNRAVLESLLAFFLVFFTLATVCESTQPLAAAMCLSLSPINDEGLDSIVFTDGTTLVGRIISETSALVVFEHSLAGVKSQHAFFKNKITEIRRGKSPAVRTDPANKSGGSAGAQRAVAPPALKLSAELAAVIGAIEVTAEVTGSKLESSNRFTNYKTQGKPWINIDLKRAEQGDGIPRDAVEGRLKSTHKGQATLSIRLAVALPIPLVFVDGSNKGECVFAVTPGRAIEVDFERVDCNEIRIVDLASIRRSQDYGTNLASLFEDVLVDHLLARAKIGLAIDANTLVMGKFAKVDDTWRVVPESCEPLSASARVSPLALKGVAKAQEINARYLKEVDTTSPTRLAAQVPDNWDAPLVTERPEAVVVFRGCWHCTSRVLKSVVNCPGCMHSVGCTGDSDSGCKGCIVGAELAHYVSELEEAATEEKKRKLAREYDRLTGLSRWYFDKASSYWRLGTTGALILGNETHNIGMSKNAEAQEIKGELDDMNRQRVYLCSNHKITTVSKPGLRKMWESEIVIGVDGLPGEHPGLVLLLESPAFVGSSSKLSPIPKSESQFRVQGASFETVVLKSDKTANETRTVGRSPVDGRERHVTPKELLAGARLFYGDQDGRVYMYRFDIDSAQPRFTSTRPSFDDWATFRGLDPH